MLNRLKKKIYICSRIEDTENVDGIERFEKPQSIYLNIRSLTGETVLESGGEVNNNVLIAKFYDNLFDVKENDRAYVYSSPSDIYDILATNADYTLKSKSIVHNITELLFERRI